MAITTKKRRGFLAKGVIEARMRGVVFHQKGTTITHPRTGRVVVVPGGQWEDGKEGKWYDYGVLHSNPIVVKAWKWTLTRFRIKMHTLLQRTLGALANKLRGGSK